MAQQLNAYNTRAKIFIMSLNNVAMNLVSYVHQGGYVFCPPLAVCMSVCLLATSHEIYCLNLCVHFIREVFLDKAVSITFWK